MSISIVPIPTLAPQTRPPQPVRAGLVAAIAHILGRGQPTYFAREGLCRSGVRAALVMRGFRWVNADTYAASVVAQALRSIGARRPTWDEGQPEWTQDGVIRAPRETCFRCRTPLPEGHWRFCSDGCAKATRVAQFREMQRDAYNASMRAFRAAWAAKQVEQECHGCGAMFRPRKPGQRYCRQQCKSLITC